MGYPHYRHTRANTISHSLFYFKSCLLDLPSMLLRTLAEGGSRFQELKKTISSLEDAIAKALTIQEQIRVLQSLKNYLPEDEIEMILSKSDEKIKEALVFHELVKDLKRDPGLKTKLNIIELNVLDLCFPNKNLKVP